MTNHDRAVKAANNPPGKITLFGVAMWVVIIITAFLLWGGGYLLTRYRQAGVTVAPRSKFDAGEGRGR